MKKVAYSKLPSNVLGLSRLPIPPLADTFRRYKASVEPLKKADAVAAHFEKLDAFEKTTAKEMNDKLIQVDKENATKGGYPHSYIEPLWDDGYLAYRGPSPVNIAPALSFKPIKGLTGQCETAAAYITGILKYIKKMTDGEGLDVANPAIDLSPQVCQFGFSRIPLAERDTTVQVQHPSLSRTVTVLCKGKIFSVRVIDADGNPYETGVIVKALEAVVSAAPEAAVASLSFFTSGGRSDWATSYSDLIKKDPENEKSLKEIQDSLICVCLDSEHWGKDTGAKMSAMLFGGTEVGNRWYDKHQLIFDADGAAAACFEHSLSDGIQWSRWMGEIHADLSGKKSGFEPLPKLTTGKAPESAADLVKPLEFQFGKTFGARIRTAEQELQKLTRGVLLEEVVLPFGKKKLKQLKMSPDAFCQIVMHWSYYQLRSKVAPTYEACSTCAFWHGRTETIRTATNEMRALITSEELHTLDDLSTENAEMIYAKVSATAKKHQLLAKEASQGLGVDRHLLALKDIVKTNRDTDGLAFFNDELFQYSGTWVMSTSNISAPFVESFNFGPVAPHGLGIGYVIQDDTISLSVSSFQQSSKTKIKDFQAKVISSAEALLRHLERMNKK